MKRKAFIKNLTLGACSMMSLTSFASSCTRPNGHTMPTLFVGHGTPMNALENNVFTKQWKVLAAALPKPKAILSISAHWFINKTKVTAMPMPKTIYDFYGFPQALYDASYPAPGAPEFAETTSQLVDMAQIEMDHEWGLDHGTWSVLIQMYPKADVPVYQLSIDYTKDAAWHYKLAQQLKELRKKGVLILGSGNIVHNLRMMNMRQPDTGFDWAIEFDQYFKQCVDDRDFEALIDYSKIGKMAELAIPTPEHYLPSIYTLGLVDKKEAVEFHTEACMAGSISMRSFLVN